MNTSIYFDEEKKFNIGCKVVLWNEDPSYSFYSAGKYKPRSSNDALAQITQCVMHHTVTYTAKQAYVGLVGRGLSVNFLVDDDENEDGCATVYQCLMIKDIGYSQKPVNHLGPGIEICYRPEAWQDPSLYSEKNIKNFNVKNHDIILEKIHNMNLKVFKPTQAQLNSCARIAFGINKLCPNVKLEFPKNELGEYSKTTINNVEKYSGLLGHYNITNQKIDPAGFDHQYVEWLAQRCKEESIF